MLDLRAEESRVRRERLIEILDGNAEVMDAARLHAGEATGELALGGDGARCADRL